MQITRRTDYAIRCVLFLARRNREVAMIGEIAEEMEIPRAFLAKIVQTLATAGIVQSHRGMKGGLALGRNPSEISLYDVIYAMEGPIGFNRCALSDRACALSSTCVIHPVWTQLRVDVERTLKNRSFADFVLTEGRRTDAYPVEVLDATAGEE